jgi:uncharacterized membrane protein YidH (DUF202 family)
VRLWNAVTKRPDTVPLATYRFLSWLKTTCNITAAGVDIVTFLRHPVTAAQADKLTHQMVWDGEGDPADTVATICSIISAQQQHTATDADASAAR